MLSHLVISHTQMFCSVNVHCFLFYEWPPNFGGRDPITSWEIDGETVETVSDIISGAPKSLQMVISAMKLKDPYSLEEKL